MYVKTINDKYHSLCYQYGKAEISSSRAHDSIKATYFSISLEKSKGRYFLVLTNRSSCNMFNGWWTDNSSYKYYAY